MQHAEGDVRSYTEELALVRDLLEQGDRTHALHHCVAALIQEPHRREWAAPLRELLANKDLVTTLESDTFFGAHAALAFHQHATGAVVDALDSISKVAVSVPDLGFQRWFVSWLPEATTNVPPHVVKRILTLATTFGVGRMRLLAAERAAAEELAPVAEYALATVSDPFVLWLASATFRRAGRYDEAIDAGTKARPGLPADVGGTALGLALRGKGQFERACEVFDEIFAATKHPDFLHEKKRVLADAGMWAEALEVAVILENQTELGSENLAEHAELRARLTRNAPPPTEPPFDVVCRRALGHGRLLSMNDATANGLRGFLAKQRESATEPTALGAMLRTDKVTLSVNGAEGPSNRLALAALFGGSPDPRLAQYTSTAGSPMRSLTDRADQFTLWKQEGDVVVQALPAPPGAVLDWVEELALFEASGVKPDTIFESQADFLDMWSEAKRKAPVDAPPRDWVAAAIYPRVPLFRVAMGPDWIYRWQVAALIGLARSEAGWTGTRRRDAFRSLLDGAIDWPLAASIRVLTEIALDEPETTSEIRAWMIALAPTLGRVENGAIPATLLMTLGSLPYVAEHHIDQLRAALEAGTAQNDDASEDDRSEDNAASRPEGPRRRWWQFWKR